ncbi:MAG TPA: TIGR00730 family Rossman fold protein [Rhizomicrobium sp.]|nr:TIGR00730 family Rossman fold protein [Rhizomicrobium sp.]
MHNPSDKMVNRRFLCVFCGSSMGHDEAFGEAARETGRLIAAHGFGLVFGGGSLGLMGQTARAARDSGAPVIGIVPGFLRYLEPPLKHAEQLIVTPDLYQRKDRMMAMASAFIILPGGLGTLDELFEVVTSAQLEQHEKPIAIVNVNGFYDPLAVLLEHHIAAGFARPEIAQLYRFVPTPADALAFIEQALAASAFAPG